MYPSEQCVDSESTTFTRVKLLFGDLSGRGCVQLTQNSSYQVELLCPEPSTNETETGFALRQYPNNGSCGGDDVAVLSVFGDQTPFTCVAGTGSYNNSMRPFWFTIQCAGNTTALPPVVPDYKPFLVAYTDDQCQSYQAEILSLYSDATLNASNIDGRCVEDNSYWNNGSLRMQCVGAFINATFYLASSDCNEN